MSYFVLNIGEEKGGDKNPLWASQASLWNGTRPGHNWKGNKPGTCLKISKTRVNNEINSAAYCLQPHRGISLLPPLTISLIIKAFSQEVMNVMLNIAIRKVSFSSSMCWRSTQSKKLRFNRLALPAASSPGGMGPSGQLGRQIPFPESHQTLIVCGCWGAQSLQ